MNIKIGIPQVIVLWWFAMDSGILFYKYMNSIKDETEVAASIVISVCSLTKNVDKHWIFKEFYVIINADVN